MPHSRERRGRSIAKAVAYRLFILMADTAIIFAVTRNYKITTGVIILSNISSTILYFLHERAWDKIEWGRVHSTDI